MNKQDYEVITRIEDEHKIATIISPCGHRIDYVGNVNDTNSQILRAARGLGILDCYECEKISKGLAS